ncbi:unnamed protein product [Bursaphelenchus xylophilus]|uniref:(pine wood nematode) hypothetical protein n=1 Tax=Bursaphelenchus xylophilus TaxID=6326 RepID=A0A1I7SUH7_BURXY|nr:unnamed protein product [Bursaphelenchus xylophilus]CAG9107116.1 unnamed protein product [Bursaphelenchus xylophilus]
MLLRLLVVFVLPFAESAKSCGREAIPYILSVDLAGKPELACDTPACFGPLKSPLIDDFNEDQGQLSVLHRTASCSGKYTNIPCTGNDEWTGGVAEYNNGTHISLTMECCRFEGLNYATEHKIALVRPGERYVGGAVKENGRLIAFDLVKEVRKNVAANNEVHYVAHVYRMSCVPAPSHPLNKVDPTMTTGEYLSRRLSAKSRNPNKRKQHSSRLNRYRGQYDYEYYSYERPMYRRGPGRNTYRRGGRRRYKPYMDDYEYYEQDMRPARRQSYHQDVLWPINDDKKSSPPSNFKAHASKNIETNQGPDYPMNDAQRAEELPFSYSNSVPTAENTVTIPPQHDSSYAQPSLVAPAASQDTYSIALQPSVLPSYVVPTQPENSYALQPSSYQQPSYVSETAQQPQPDVSCTSTCCTPSCSMNSMFSSLQCFSGDMLVETPSGHKRMDELEVGDLVMSMDGALITYSKVVMFLHRKEKEDALYRHIRTSNGRDLKITPYHLMYTTKCKAGDRLRLVKAADIVIGDCIHYKGSQGLRSSKVVSIKDVNGNGIYAPLTANGDMFVNNILVSCHSNMAAQTLQQTFFAWWRQWTGYIKKITSFVYPYQKLISDDGELPFGVDYLTTVMDLFVPQNLISY